MRCCTSVDRCARALWLTFIATLLCANDVRGASIDEQPGFEILDASSYIDDGIHRVNARIRYRFSQQAIEAMDNGVAITISLRMEVLRERPVVNESIAAVRARYRIQAHSLSQRYVVRNLNTDESMTFQDLGAVVAALGEVRDFPLLDDQVLEEGERYRARIRATLDIESLPTPLRLLAYLSTPWRLSSEWKSWPLAR